MIRAGLPTTAPSAQSSLHTEEYEGKVTPVFSDSMETVVFRPFLAHDDLHRERLLAAIVRVEPERGNIDQDVA